MVTGLSKLTDKQLKKLYAIGAKFEKKAKISDNDQTVKQFVHSEFGYHFLFIYYRTVENLADDTWSVNISTILELIVDQVTGEVPFCTNVTPVTIVKDGEVLLNAEFAESDLDEDAPDEE